MNLYRKRLSTLQSQVPPETAVLVSDHHDLAYLCGFDILTPYERECFLLITPYHIQLLLGAFSSQPEIQGVHQSRPPTFSHLGEHLRDFLKKHNLPALVIDPQTLTTLEFLSIQQQLMPDQLSTAYIWKNLRRIKDEHEIQMLREANHRTHRALSHTLAHLSIGMSERDVQYLFESQVEKLPSEQFAFPTIVAFGVHTALPHHQPTDRKLQDNEAVLIDCGATYQKYCADVTRTIWFGDTPDPEFSKIEKNVHVAYRAVLSQLTTHHSQLISSDLDVVARTLIKDSGYGPNFIHTTGHGVGLSIHESPSISSRDQTPMLPNMVITIEPGIYLEGKFGYRYENSILLTQGRPEELGVNI